MTTKINRNPGRPLTVREMSILMGVRTEVIYHWIHSGQLPSINVAKKPDGQPRWRIPADTVETFINRRAAGLDPTTGKRPKPKRCSFKNLIEFF